MTQQFFATRIFSDSSTQDLTNLVAWSAASDSGTATIIEDDFYRNQLFTLDQGNDLFSANKGAGTVTIYQPHFSVPPVGASSPGPHPRTSRLFAEGGCHGKSVYLVSSSMKLAPYGFVQARCRHV
jgi:hypothetical protein